MATSALTVSAPLFSDASQWLGSDSVGCVLMEHGGRIVSVTRSFATMLGSDVEGLFGQNVFDLLSRDDSQARVRLLTDGRKMRVVLQTGGPSFFWSAHRIAPGAALGGYYVGLLRGEDEREPLSLRLVNSEQLATLGAIMANVAHEIVGPLTVLANNADLLLGEEGVSSKERKGLTTIRDQAFRLNALLEEILGFACEAPPELKAQDAATLISKALEAFGPLASDKEIHWRIQAEASLPQVVGDAKRLQQVFHMLFKDAWERSLDGSEIKITVRRQKRNEVFDAIEFVIANQGKGIVPEELKRICEPFCTTKPSRRGTGLRLTVVQQIVAAHQGTLTLTSAPGGGTTVTVSLPASQR